MTGPRRDEGKRLEEIRARTERATPGPWECGGPAQISLTFDQEANIIPPDTMATHGFQYGGPVAVVSVSEEAEDWPFIAHSREDVPFLLDLVDRLRADLARAEAERDRTTHQLRQERERRESIERRHKNLILHQGEYSEARRRLEVELDALLRVWCSGSCGTGVLRWITPGQYPHWNQHRTEVTEEIVAFAEHNTKRLRTWFENNKRKPLAPSPGAGGGE